MYRPCEAPETSLCFIYCFIFLGFHFLTRCVFNNSRCIWFPYLFCVFCFVSLRNRNAVDIVRSKRIFIWKIKRKFILIITPTFYNQMMSGNIITLGLTLPVIFQESQFLLFSKSRNIVSKFKALDKVHSISKWQSQNLKTALQGFPCDPVVKNLHSNAEDARLIPGGGTRIPHAVGLLSLHPATKTQHSQKNKRTTKNPTKSPQRLADKLLMTFNKKLIALTFQGTFLKNLLNSISNCFET